MPGSIRPESGLDAAAIAELNRQGIPATAANFNNMKLAILNNPDLLGVVVAESNRNLGISPPRMSVRDQVNNTIEKQDAIAQEETGRQQQRVQGSIRGDTIRQTPPQVPPENKMQVQQGTPTTTSGGDTQDNDDDTDIPILPIPAVRDKSRTNIRDDIMNQIDAAERQGITGQQGVTLPYNQPPALDAPIQQQQQLEAPAKQLTDRRDVKQFSQDGKNYTSVDVGGSNFVIDQDGYVNNTTQNIIERRPSILDRIKQFLISAGFNDIAAAIKSR